eukprot:g15754.t1
MVRFQPVSRSLGGALPGPEPREEGVDPYDRSNSFLDEGEAVDGMSVIPFECLPPMLPNMEEVPYLPPRAGSYYTIVLDLDETLVHYFEEASGAGTDTIRYYDMRPGCISFLERLNQLGCEIVVFTAATQDYADWVMDQIDPNKLIHHRLYRQHALPWGPLFIKDLSKLGRPLERTLIIDNVAENFMLQPEHGIFIQAWYDDQNDMALIDLQPLLEELVTSQSTVPGILRKYAAAIPHWAGWRAEASDEELVLEGGGADEDVLGEEGDEAAGVRHVAKTGRNMVSAVAVAAASIQYARRGPAYPSPRGRVSDCPDNTNNAAPSARATGPRAPEQPDDVESLREYTLIGAAGTGEWGRTVT